MSPTLLELIDNMAAYSQPPVFNSKTFYKALALLHCNFVRSQCRTILKEYLYFSGPGGSNDIILDICAYPEQRNYRLKLQKVSTRRFCESKMLETFVSRAALQVSSDKN
jgi:hypothetical protein